jgi:preprotein translocase subunit SecA
MIDAADLSPLDQYLVPQYGAKELARWCNNKIPADLLDGAFTADDFTRFQSEDGEIDEAAEYLMDKARQAYRQREVAYPVNFIIDLTGQQVQQDPVAALTQFCAWVKMKYELDWTPDTLPTRKPLELRDLLIEEAKKWDDDRIEDRASRVLVNARTVDEIDSWLQEHVRIRLSDEERARAEDDPKAVLQNKFRNMLRAELTQFERWVLLQIVDQAWKDHLYGIDQLRESIGLRSFSQLDPRIEFKREGARLFDEMWEKIRDQVTDLIFKGKLMPQVVPSQQQQPQGGNGAPAQTAPQDQAQRQPASPPTEDPAAAAVAAAAAAASAGTDAQRRDIEAADRAGASQQPAEKPKRKPVRVSNTIGRNELVTITNPSTGETRELKFKKAQPLIEDGWKLVTHAS